MAGAVQLKQSIGGGEYAVYTLISTPTVAAASAMTCVSVASQSAAITSAYCGFRRADFYGFKAFPAAGTAGAPTNNTGIVYLGPSNNRAASGVLSLIAIAPGESVSITAPDGIVLDLRDWFFGGASAGDLLTIYYI